MYFFDNKFLIYSFFEIGLLVAEKVLSEIKSDKTNESVLFLHGDLVDVHD